MRPECNDGLSMCWLMSWLCMKFSVPWWRWE